MNENLEKTNSYEDLRADAETSASWTQMLKGVLSRGLDEAKCRLESHLNSVLASCVEEELHKSMWTDEEAEELESNLLAFWNGISSSEYPVFSMAAGKSASLQQFLNDLVTQPSPVASRAVDPSVSLFESLFDDAWLDWRFGLGAFHLLDLRRGVQKSHKDLPDTFRQVDLEFHFLDTQDDVEAFLELKVHGLGQVKHVYRIFDASAGMEPAKHVLVMLNDSLELSKEQLEEVRDAAQGRGWTVMQRSKSGVWQGGGPSEHLGEKISLFLPRCKQGAFARLCKSDALRKAEAHEVVRFCVLLAGYAGTMALPGTVISLMTAIHGYMLLRIAWLFGRDVDATLLGQSVAIAGSSVTLGYGARALMGTMTSGVPLLGKFFSSLMLGGITEELGERAIKLWSKKSFVESLD